ncbi:hypothetical protein GMRT_11114 [Giardia muris]|uniref:Uncharacterized protein n=1 Tax=Giardia muris TaxID=5742 RepID=A0A4Z1T4M3_GIAMU|nr:hypothetical protein GMRT_11114 [Giardia muris]|eukprot:TNJ28943.1 hypothetical protein GMRT_11114 [Giardia muris]
MASAFDELGFLVSEITPDLASIQALQEDGRMGKLKDLFQEGIAEGDVYTATEFFLNLLNLPEECFTAILNEDEFLTLLGQIKNISNEYVDQYIFLNFLAEAHEKIALHGFKLFCLDLCLSFFETNFQALNETKEEGSNALELVPLICTLAYKTIMSFSLFYALSNLGGQEYVDVCMKTRLLVLYTARLLVRPLRSATVLPLLVSFFTVFSLTEVQGCEEGTVPYDEVTLFTIDSIQSIKWSALAKTLLGSLVNIITTQEKAVGMGVIASTLKVIHEENYDAIAHSASKATGYLLMMHTLLGVGQNITYGLETLLTRFGHSAYEEFNVEILCRFLAYNAQSDSRIANILADSNTLIHWLDRLLHTPEPSDQVGASFLAKTLLDIGASTRTFGKELLNIAQGTPNFPIDAPTHYSND